MPFRRVLDEKDIKGLIITGSGEKAFVAGADIHELSELNELNGRKFSVKTDRRFLSLLKTVINP
jgi:enoyl-CoA hydratase/carnithine racemase